VPWISDPAAFAALRILHGENGLLVDRTIVAPDQPARALLPDRKEPIVMISVQEPLDAATIASLPAGVRAIATYSAGHEHLDLAAARARGIAVFSLPDALSEAVAEVGMFLLLGAARRATESIDLIRSRVQERFHVELELEISVW